MTHTTPSKQMGVKELISILALIAACSGGVAWGFGTFQTKEAAEIESTACQQRVSDIKEILNEMKTDIKEIRKEQRRER